MTIPTYDQCMLPLLRLTARTGELSLLEAVASLSKEFSLTPGEVSEMLPSGRQAKFHNRVGWAKSDLVAAGLLVVTGRARFNLTDRGIAVLKSPPVAIDRTFLSQFPEFQRRMVKQVARTAGDGTAADNAKSQQVSPSIDLPNQTPREAIEVSYQLLRANLAKELLDRVKLSHSTFFERLVIDVLVAMGYGGSVKDAGQAIGRSGDGGIDGVIKEDPLGLDAVYIQAKRWEQPVGRPIVQGFTGSLEGVRARKGVLITTSVFTKDAQDYVSRIEKRVVLIDGEMLTNLMIDYGVGVAIDTTITLQRIDHDYFEDGN